ncbi:hypothetical protein GOE00_31915 [Sinorhizobium medicae]|uniref:hypothetical protein n=1 Tax=Sinorhizobium medicae TaxID=110321 RepID=UPI0029AE388E|nr:hypothetical protein [Sinorhizobium medicae]
MMREFVFRAFLAAGTLVFPCMSRADFIDTNWTVIGWTGEAWYINTQAVIGKFQSFYKGEASGVFYECDFKGQSSAYTIYDTVEDFLKNPEFETLKPAEKDLRLSGPKIFVHRITCEGEGNPKDRRVLYPFVTTEKRHSAYYLFEGGYFTLSRP